MAYTNSEGQDQPMHLFAQGLKLLSRKVMKNVP